MYRKYETSLKCVSFAGFSRQPARYPTHLASSRATKKLSRCFAIYRPSDISRKDCFFSWLQKSRLALDTKKMPSISPRWVVKSAVSSALRISITLPVGPLQWGGGSGETSRYQRIVVCQWIARINMKRQYAFSSRPFATVCFASL